MSVYGPFVNPNAYVYQITDTEKCVMFFGLQVDRGNLVQAVADNLLNDLHLNTNGNLFTVATNHNLLTIAS